MGDVVKWNGHTYLDIDPADMLRAIADEKPVNAFVITWDNDRIQTNFYSSTTKTPIVLMRLNEFIHKYYNGDFQ